MLIIYLTDERIGSEIAQKMVLKGFENTVLVTGGIEQFIEECYDLVEGTDLPPQPKKPAEKTAAMKRTGMGRPSSMKHRHDDCKKDKF